MKNEKINKNSELVAVRLSKEKDYRIIELLNATEGKNISVKLKKLLRRAGNIPEPEEHNVMLNRGGNES